MSSITFLVCQKIIVVVPRMVVSPLGGEFDEGKHVILAFNTGSIRGDRVALLIKAAVRAAEYSWYAIFLCCDQKFKPYHR